MNNKHIIMTGACAFSMLGILALLYATSPLTKDIYRGDFDRTMIAGKLIKQSKEITLPYNSYYVAGTSFNTVYLGNYTNAFHLIQMNLTTLDSQHIKLKFKRSEEFTNYEDFRVKIDSPYFFLVNGTIPVIFRGMIFDGVATQIKNDYAFFADIEPINRSSFVLKSFSKKSQSMELAKLLESSKDIAFNYQAIEKQVDGIFCTQGILARDRTTNEIVYTYSLRNQYVVLDSGLRIKYRAQTLDTFSVARIEFTSLDNNTRMATGVPTYINKLSTVNNSLLFINSNIMSKNDEMQLFIEGSTVDIYNVKGRKYVGSLNFHDINNHKISDLELVGDKLITIQDKFLQVHSLNMDYIENH